MLMPRAEVRLYWQWLQFGVWLAVAIIKAGVLSIVDKS